MGRCSLEMRLWVRSGLGTFCVFVLFCIGAPLPALPPPPPPPLQVRVQLLRAGSVILELGCGECLYTRGICSGKSIMANLHVAHPLLLSQGIAATLTTSFAFAAIVNAAPGNPLLLGRSPLGNSPLTPIGNPPLSLR